MSWTDYITGSIRPNGSIDFNALVKTVFEGESEENREALAKRQIRRELGVILRRWTAEVEQPLIPDLLDGYVERDGEYVHASQLSLKEWDVRILKLDQTIRTLVARRTAMQEARDQASDEGIA